MADDGAKQSINVWPIPKFSFIVNLGKGIGDAVFQEASGLDKEAQIIEYRDGDSPVFSTQKIPGLVKFGNITLKKGILKKDNQFLDWYNAVKMNTIKRVAITIKLVDEGGKAIMTWTLQNAWPSKISGTDLKSDGNEVAVETIEIAYEGLEIENN